MEDLLNKIKVAYPLLDVSYLEDKKYYPQGGGWIYISYETGPWFIAIGLDRIDAAPPHPNVPFKRRGPHSSDWVTYEMTVGDPNYFVNLKTLIDSYLTLHKCDSTR